MLHFLPNLGSGKPIVPSINLKRKSPSVENDDATFDGVVDSDSVVAGHSIDHRNLFADSFFAFITDWVVIEISIGCCGVVLASLCLK